jgi:hypothetical protein
MAICPNGHPNPDYQHLVEPEFAPPPAGNTPWYRQTAVLALAGMLGGLLLLAGAAIAVALAVVNSNSGELAVPLALGSGAAPTSTSSLAPAIRDWKKRATEHLQESARDLDAVASADQAQDVAGVRAGCQRLHDANTVGLQADLPSPDPAVTAAIQSMIDDINTAAHACMTFTTTMNPADADAYQNYLDQAMTHLQTGLDIVNRDLAGG